MEGPRGRSAVRAEGCVSNHFCVSLSRGDNKLLFIFSYPPIEYVDQASGKDLNRPEWKRLTADWRAGRMESAGRGAPAG